MRTSTLGPIRAVIFDMDGTLYRNARLDRWYEESIHRLVAARFGLSGVAARRRFREFYSRLSRSLRVRPSKLFTLEQMGISDRAWARRFGRAPVAAHLRPDRKLQAALSALAGRFRLGLVTNNHQRNTRATLRRLGVAGRFDEVLTLSQSRTFKPDPGLYRLMARRLGVSAQDCLSVGDRYHLDLAPAAAVGMQTLLVQRMQDVYRLPARLRPRRARRVAAGSPGQKRRAAATAARALRAGRLVVLPTDTVYGLAALPEAESVRWLYRAKGRQPGNPVVLLLADPSAAGRYARLSSRAQGLIRRHWPGALTLVLPAKPGTSWGGISRGGRTVALRVPENDLCRRMIRLSGGALAVTSANASGAPAPVSARNLDLQILAFSELVVDAGPARVGKPSTVARVREGKVELLRPGTVRLGA